MTSGFIVDFAQRLERANPDAAEAKGTRLAAPPFLAQAQALQVHSATRTANQATIGAASEQRRRVRQ